MKKSIFPANFVPPPQSKPIQVQILLCVHVYLYFYTEANISFYHLWRVVCMFDSYNSLP